MTSYTHETTLDHEGSNWYLHGDQVWMKMLNFFHGDHYNSTKPETTNPAQRKGGKREGSPTPPGINPDLFNMGDPATSQTNKHTQDGTRHDSFFYLLNTLRV